MLVRPYFLTLLFSGDGEPVPVVSPDPGLEKEWSRGTDYYKVIAWERPFPLWLAEAICQELASLLTVGGRGRPFSPSKTGRIICKIARNRGWQGTGRWFEPPDRPVFPGLFGKRDSFARLLPQVLAGRLYSLREIAGSLSRMGLAVMEGALEFLVHLEVLDGRVERLAGVGLTTDGRSGAGVVVKTPDLEDFYPEAPCPAGSAVVPGFGPRDQPATLYCRRGALLAVASPVSPKGTAQVSLGESREESPGESFKESPQENLRGSLGEGPGESLGESRQESPGVSSGERVQEPGESPQESSGESLLESPGEGIRQVSATSELPLVLPELTPWQKATAREVLAFWEREELRSFLIWAVCGAGKTEVVFFAIHRALSEGKRVLLTVPRREIAKDLGKRVEDCFPDWNSPSLWREETGTPRRRPGGGYHPPTPQVYSLFHLAILDEADAYPYRENRMLTGALANALLPGKINLHDRHPDEEWRGEGRGAKSAFPSGSATPRSSLTRAGPLKHPRRRRSGKLATPPEVLSFLRQAGRKPPGFAFFPRSVDRKGGPCPQNAGLLPAVDLSTAGMSIKTGSFRLSTAAACRSWPPPPCWRGV